MNGDQLKSWRERLKFTSTEAAQQLGVSLDTYSRMERRDALSRQTALACAAISYGLKPMDGPDE